MESSTELFSLRANRQEIKGSRKVTFSVVQHKPPQEFHKDRLQSNRSVIVITGLITLHYHSVVILCFWFVFERCFLSKWPEINCIDW